MSDAILTKSMIKIAFTDGTAWYAFNGDYPFNFKGGTVYQFVQPNTYIFDDGYIANKSYNNYDVEKTDYDGNRWRFTNTNGSKTIQINDDVINFYEDPVYVHFIVYEPSTHTLSVARIQRFSYGSGLSPLPSASVVSTSSVFRSDRACRRRRSRALKK